MYSIQKHISILFNPKTPYRHTIDKRPNPAFQISGHLCYISQLIHMCLVTTTPWQGTWKRTLYEDLWWRGGVRVTSPTGNWGKPRALWGVNDRKLKCCMLGRELSSDIPAYPIPPLHPPTDHKYFQGVRPQFLYLLVAILTFRKFVEKYKSIIVRIHDVHSHHLVNVLNNFCHNRSFVIMLLLEV